MSIYILIIGVIISLAGAKIGYDWVIIGSLRAIIKRQDIVIESLSRVEE